MIDINEVLRGRHTITCTIDDVADTHREHVKQKLIESLKYRAVTICPDFGSTLTKIFHSIGLSFTYSRQSLSIFLD